MKMSKTQKGLILKVTTDRKMNILKEEIVGETEIDLGTLSEYFAEKYIEYVKSESQKLQGGIV